VIGQNIVVWSPMPPAPLWRCRRRRYARSGQPVSLIELYKVSLHDETADHTTTEVVPCQSKSLKNE